MEYPFQISQWKFVVPVLSTDRFRYSLEPEQILPFTLLDDVVKQGAFGRVYRVGIHHSHIDHPAGEIAVKQIIVSGSKEEQKAINDAWPNEVRALQIIKDLDNAHLIHCIAAIERDKSRYLLFPWANGGNLKEHWEKEPRQAPNEANIKEALTQLKGLAGALRCLHYFGRANESEDPFDTSMEDASESDVSAIINEYSRVTLDGSIRHGDLKPENLLWFFDDQKRRCLKIADLGLAKRHVIATQDRSNPTATRHGTVLYEAPEAQTAATNQPRSRQYDIWSVGCITLEWIIWILYGNDQLKSFYDDLKGSDRDYGPYYAFDTPGHPPTLHPAVAYWMTYILNNHPICQRDSAIKDLLKLASNLPPSEGPAERPGTTDNKREIRKTLNGLVD
ncbi:hypothetical protein CEP53_002156 [Fusarium sp. AF-6]|nr:hypothetical protein CEP53_002156 [Fusarium sp. AF-6]